MRTTWNRRFRACTVLAPSPFGRCSGWPKRPTAIGCSLAQQSFVGCLVGPHDRRSKTALEPYPTIIALGYECEPYLEPKCTSCGSAEGLAFVLAPAAPLPSRSCHSARFWAFIRQNGWFGSANRHFRLSG